MSARKDRSLRVLHHTQNLGLAHLAGQELLNPSPLSSPKIVCSRGRPHVRIDDHYFGAGLSQDHRGIDDRVVFPSPAGWKYQQCLCAPPVMDKSTDVRSCR